MTTCICVQMFGEKIFEMVETPCSQQQGNEKTEVGSGSLSVLRVALLFTIFGLF